MYRAHTSQVLSEQRDKLNPTQYEALHAGLTQRVALIQGPPGTGKTHTGVVLCDAIVKHSKETILCVCYTNHALDQFLEALLDKGITGIVRVGRWARVLFMHMARCVFMPCAPCTSGSLCAYACTLTRKKNFWLKA